MSKRFEYMLKIEVQDSKMFSKKKERALLAPGFVEYDLMKPAQE